MVLPRLLEIARENRQDLADMVEIGRTLGLERKDIEQIERYLLAEKFLRPSQHGGIVSIDQLGQVAWSSLPRVVTEHWTETIFTVLDHPELQTALEEWAGNHGCQITAGESPSDIAAIPYFIAVIDRTILGKEAWEFYLEFRADTFQDQDDQPSEVCILVDPIRTMEMPTYDPVLCFDLRESHSIPWIVKAVEFAKDLVDRANR